MTSISRSGRSNTCRLSTSRCIETVSPARQSRHACASCRTTRSGWATCRSVSPLCSACPPLFLSERPRRLPGMRGFFFSPSLDGGLERVELSKSSRRRRSAFCACNASLLARNPSFSARSVALSARWAARNASFARRSHATSPRNCQMSPMSAAIGSRIVAGVIPTLTYTSALRVSINHPPAQNSRRLLQIGLTQLGSYTVGRILRTPGYPSPSRSDGNS